MNAIYCCFSQIDICWNLPCSKCDQMKVTLQLFQLFLQLFMKSVISYALCPLSDVGIFQYVREYAITDWFTTTKGNTDYNLVNAIEVQEWKRMIALRSKVSSMHLSAGKKAKVELVAVFLHNIHNRK